MNRIVPSAAVRAIAAIFPFTNAPAQPEQGLGYEVALKAAAVVAIVDAVPSELLRLSADDLATFVTARATVAAFVDAALSRGSGAQALSTTLLIRLRELLERCPDQAVPATTATLAFVLEDDLRESLRTDIAEVERAVLDGEWKSATVLAGSVIEALLLWALSSYAPHIVNDTASRLEKAGVIKTAEVATLERWDLHQYIEVAGSLGVVESSDTLPQLRLARGFRNLIHPGRALRLARKCDRPTALAATAGLEFLIRDLSRGPRP